jgi:DNA-binding MarR family transcriptional regulator
MSDSVGEKQNADDPQAKLGREDPKRNSDNRSKESLSSLNQQLNDPALKSSARILILISLTINRKMSFGELLALTGLGKGSLENHLEKLEEQAYIVRKNTKTFDGTRQVVLITAPGEQVCRLLMRRLQDVGSDLTLGS